MARKSDKTPAAPHDLAGSGLVVGGMGGPQDELLQAGQEEVFSRTEVESGRIEHQADTDGSGEPTDDDRQRSG